VALNRRFFASALKTAARLPLRFSLSSLFIVVTLAALVMAWNISAQGSAPIHTDRELGMAIFGIGYFQVTMPNGQICYTRCGHFSLNGNGQIVAGRSDDEILLEPSIGTPQDMAKLLIPPDGLVRVRNSNGGSWNRVGQIQLVRFVNPDGLIRVAPDIWEETESSGPPLSTEPGKDGTGFVYQGWLEPTAGPPREQLRFQLELFGAGAMALWVVVQNRGMRNELSAIRRKLEIAT
jgi:flagellar basal body rod protein FlgG